MKVFVYSNSLVRSRSSLLSWKLPRLQCLLVGGGEGVVSSPCCSVLIPCLTVPISVSSTLSNNPSFSRISLSEEEEEKEEEERERGRDNRLK